MNWVTCPWPYVDNQFQTSLASTMGIDKAGSLTLVVAFATTAASCGYAVMFENFAVTVTLANGRRLASWLRTIVVLSVVELFGPLGVSALVLLSYTSGWTFSVWA